MRERKELADFREKKKQRQKQEDEHLKHEKKNTNRELEIKLNDKNWILAERLKTLKKNNIKT